MRRERKTGGRETTPRKHKFKLCLQLLVHAFLLGGVGLGDWCLGGSISGWIVCWAGGMLYVGGIRTKSNIKVLWSELLGLTITMTN